jgi:23S rRNA (adenine2503-C2)-methyltransferase
MATNEIRLKAQAILILYKSVSGFIRMARIMTTRHFAALSKRQSQMIMCRRMLASNSKIIEKIDSQVATDSEVTRLTLAGDGKVNLYAQSLLGLEEVVMGWGFPKYRAKQLWQWLYHKGCVNFDDMVNMPKAFRAKLAAETIFGTMTLAVERTSRDGTIKRAYALHDGQMIESVLMPYNDGRNTACISSQAGCAMGCVFCATGQMGFARQLTSSEIFEQVQRFHMDLVAQGKQLTNVVLMGMGEPLGNYKNVLDAVHRIISEVGIGARHITISTVGLVPRIRRLAKEGLQVNLAVSLHAATDAERSVIMPVNQRWPLATLMAACDEYVAATGRRITFEWALIEGQNDTPMVAHTLGKLLQSLEKKCHVNLIPLNPTDGFTGKPTTSADCQVFIEILGTYGVVATPRLRRGIDIDAGCGQLKQRVQKVLGRGGAPI